MAENKTQENNQSVTNFLEQIEDEQKKKDAEEILKMMTEVSGEQPKMWGDSIIGFGKYHYKYDSGREGDFLRMGFSPRKRNFSIYFMCGFPEKENLLKQLGKHKTGKACLYVNKLDQVDTAVLKEMMQKSYEAMNKKYPES